MPGATAHRIDRYELRGLLGEGANGAVYLAFDGKLEREIAIKVLRPELAEDAAARAMFHREAKAVARLHHANILEVFDYSGAESKEVYLVMERLRGENLDSFIERRGPFDAATAASAAHEICLALAHAHAQGIVHRDLKPANVFIERDGRIVLCDFGVARSFDAGVSGTLAGRGTQMTGSPLFMSPEQLDAPDTAGPASDLFSLGTLLYYLLSGAYAFAQESLVDVMTKVLLAEPRPLREVAPGVPEALQQIVARAHEREPKNRFASADTLRAALLDFLRQGGHADPRQVLLQKLAELGRDTNTHAVTAIEALPGRSGESTILFRQEATVVKTAKTKSGARPRKSWRSLVAAAAAASLAVVGYLVLRVQDTATTSATSNDVVVSVPAAPPAPVEPPSLPPPPTAPPAPQLALPEPPQPTAAPLEAPAPQHAAPKSKSPVVTGPLSVHLVTVPWADVYIDGEKVGTTPLFRMKALLPGKHQLKLINPDFPAIERTIDVKKEMTLTFHFGER